MNSRIIEKEYNKRLRNRHNGAGNKPARMIVGAFIVKHVENLSDEMIMAAEWRLMRMTRMGYGGVAPLGRKAWYREKTNTYALADEADFIARRSQLTLPTKTTSLADEDGFIFGGCLYVLQTLAAHGVMECRGGTILGVLVGKIDEVVGKVDVEVGGLWIQLWWSVRKIRRGQRFRCENDSKLPATSRRMTSEPNLPTRLTHG